VNAARDGVAPVNGRVWLYRTEHGMRERGGEMITAGHPTVSTPVPELDRKLTVPPNAPVMVSV
jgi:hypothetical protein